MIHCCQAIFALCFAGWPVYIFIREFSTLLKVFGVFQDVCEKWKVCNRRWRERERGGGVGGRSPNRFPVCVVVITCSQVSGCAAPLFALHTGTLSYSFLTLSRFGFEFLQMYSYTTCKKKNCSHTKNIFF